MVLRREIDNLQIFKSSKKWKLLKLLVTVLLENVVKSI